MSGNTVRGSVSVFLLLTALSVASAETHVGGIISADTTWTAAASPYVVDDTILVVGGARLTVRPGVDVHVAPETRIEVAEGSLVARGSAENPIRFTSRDVGQNWYSIIFRDAAEDATYDAGGNYLSGSILKNAVIENGGGIPYVPNAPSYARGVVYAESSAPFISGCTIKDCRNSGIGSFGGSGMRVVGNTITGCTPGWPMQVGYNFAWGNGAAVHLDRSTEAILSGNTFSENNGLFEGTVYLTNCETVSLENNTVAGNDGTKLINQSWPYPWVGFGGVFIESCEDVSMSGERITGNSMRGVLVTGDCGSIQLSDDPGNPTSIFGNYGIGPDGGFPGVIGYQVANDMSFAGDFGADGIHNIDGRYVYWGTPEEAVISDGILDYLDDPSKGLVVYTPFIVPEPCSLSLLVIGGLALFRRQKGISSP